jgi:Helix-turn-helix of DDE superfamily endonuclease
LPVFWPPTHARSNGRPWGPPPVRVLPVLIHLRTDLTTRARATLFGTSQSAVVRVIHHLVPLLADALRPDPRADGTRARGVRTAIYARISNDPKKKNGDPDEPIGMGWACSARKRTAARWPRSSAGT